jgi:hypothetical protein
MAPDTAAAQPELGSALYRNMPLLALLLAFDTRWRAFRQIHRRSDDVDELHELYRPILQEVNRLGMVELFTGRGGGAFQGDAREAFTHCLDLARRSGLAWPDIVEIVNKSGEAGK